MCRLNQSPALLEPIPGRAGEACSKAPAREAEVYAGTEEAGEVRSADCYPGDFSLHLRACGYRFAGVN